MSEGEFWDAYNNKIKHYSKKHSDLDAHFFKSMLAAYGDGLNNISETISQAE